MTLALMTAVMLVGRPTPAAADITAFWGLGMTPANRSAGGFAVGVGFLVAGFEFEYARLSEDIEDGAPYLRTGMFNALIQTPTRQVQLYATAGGGFYRERLDDVQETSFGTNIGGGAKIALAGPVRLRVDYRVFNLRGSPIAKTPKRFYIGVNIGF